MPACCLIVIYNPCYICLKDTTTNDLNEYEIRDELSKRGYKQVPMTNTTLPVLSNIIRKKMWITFKKHTLYYEFCIKCNVKS